MSANNEKFVNNVGFRKKFMIVVNIIASLILFGSIVYHVVMGPGHQLSDGEMNALLILMGIASTAYGAARALPGSVEYTAPEHLGMDSTLNAPPASAPTSASKPVDLPPWHK
jgi:hypothetical protein